MADEKASDWGFLKLLLGLNTGLIGLVIYGYDHFSKLRFSRLFLPLCLALLGWSFLLMMRCAFCLVSVDSLSDEELKKPVGELGDSGHFMRSVAEYQTKLDLAMKVFTWAVVLSTIYFAIVFALPSCKSGG